MANFHWSGIHVGKQGKGGGGHSGEGVHLPPV